jgi:type VI secretion system protein ImpH
MATPSRRADPPLEETLFAEPYRFDFFQAVRLLERLQEDRAPVGREAHPAREVVRFLVHQSLLFPPSEIHALERPKESEGPPAMTIAFMGLTGPSGVLPRFYTELLMERRRVGDQTSSVFFDLFNHRVLSFFFRAWEKYRPYIAYERGEDDRFSEALFHLIGLGARPLRQRHEFPDRVLLFHAGLFAQRHRPVTMLERLLGDYFGLPITVEQFAGRWLRLDATDRSTIGASGVHNALGSSLVLGARVWDEQGTIRLRVGPLTFAQFLAYQPDGLSARPLAQMARLYVDGEFAIQVQLVLKADEVPACRLSSEPGAGARLGRFAWLKSREFERYVDDLAFEAD